MLAPSQLGEAMSRISWKLATASLALASSLWGKAPAFASAKQLVSDQTIQELKALTSVATLTNGIPVAYRHVAGSDIMQVNVSFSFGLKDLPAGSKALNEWMWASLPMGSLDHPKARVFDMIEKYGLELGCAGGIEMSSCQLGLVDDFWNEALPLFAALITKPAFTDEDSRLTKDRITTELKNTPSDPGSYVNEVVNSAYYPKGHPYRLNHDEALKELSRLTKSELVAFHQKVLNASLMKIVVVSSLPKEQVLKDLEQAFGHVKSTPLALVKPLDPPFQEKTAFMFHERTLPTAYIRIKMPAPAMTHADAVPARLLFEILSEELSDLIRTKRSLSYAVHAFLIQYSLGIGVINVSTSKPQETLQAIEEVLTALKARTFTKEELDEYRHVFATNYFLTQESHGAMAATLAGAMHYFGQPNELYDMPRKLDQVSPADIQRLASEILQKPRIGVIYGKHDFKASWARDFIKRLAASGTTKKTH